MGYTHYYTVADIDGDLHTDAIVADLKTIIRSSEIPIGDAAGTPNSSPTTNGGRFMFNGIEPDDYETFSYPPIREDWKVGGCPPGFEFCKTQYRPYDPIVCAALLVIRHHLGDGVDISSDGRPETDEGWRQGIAIYNHCFPDRTPYDQDSVTELLNARRESLGSVA